MLLMMGISAGPSLSGLESNQVYAYEALGFPWWAPVVGTFLFGFGTFARLSGANRDLLWMLLVLYIAMLGQSLGERYFGPFYGAFFGATLMALSSELVARAPRCAPALVSQVLAFWFLVPGSRGLLSVTSILGEDLQSAAIGLGEMVILIISITLGVLLGTLLFPRRSSSRRLPSPARPAGKEALIMVERFDPTRCASVRAGTAG